jgi:hypothetical protein
MLQPKGCRPGEESGQIDCGALQLFIFNSSWKKRTPNITGLTQDEMISKRPMLMVQLLFIVSNDQWTPPKCVEL